MNLEWAPFNVYVYCYWGEYQTEHYSFLVEGIIDPRPKFLSELKKGFGDRINIVVYNQLLEKRVLKEVDAYA